MLLELGVVPFGPVLAQKVPFGTIWSCFGPKGPIWYPRLGYNPKGGTPASGTASTMSAPNSAISPLHVSPPQVPT